MKKFFTAALLLTIVALAACDTLEERFTFYINESDTFTITPAMPAGVDLELSQDTILTYADSTFQLNQTRAELVQEIVLHRFGVAITDSAGADFDVLQSIDVYISADTLDEVRVAFIESVPANDTTLNFAMNLNLTNARLDDYLKQDRYFIHTRGRLRKKVTADVVVNTAIRFRAIADPF